MVQSETFYGWLQSVCSSLNRSNYLTYLSTSFQAETEELARKVDSLGVENVTLKSEINQLTEKSEKLRLENATLLVCTCSSSVNFIDSSDCSACFPLKRTGVFVFPSGKSSVLID